MARLEAEGIALVSGPVAEYIASQRKKYGPRATGVNRGAKKGRYRPKSGQRLPRLRKSCRPTARNEAKVNPKARNSVSYPAAFSG